MSEANVAIEGMTCPSCVYKIECEVGDMDGVLEAKVDLGSKRGKFKYDSAKVQPQQIIAKIVENGFKAQLVNIILYQSFINSKITILISFFKRFYL